MYSLNLAYQNLTNIDNVKYGTMWKNIWKIRIPAFSTYKLVKCLFAYLQIIVISEQH